MEMYGAMHSTLRAIGKISVTNAKRFDKKWRFSLILRTIDGLLRYGTVR
jgi:hypothetical protein